MSKPKVTECLTEAVPTQENPEWLDVLDVQVNGYRPAILLWREDYDAMRKELEELRAHRTMKKRSKPKIKAAVWLVYLEDGISMTRDTLAEAKILAANWKEYPNVAIVKYVREVKRK